jgi:HTH-type transcriptional regulator/antitoxin HigA
MRQTSGNIKPIKSEEAYEAALARAYDLMQMDLDQDAEASDELEVLSLLIEDYEEKHYPLPPPHPLDAIRFRIEQMGYSAQELNVIFGSRSCKSEVLSGKRKLSLEMIMIRRLSEKLRIPAGTLIQAY